MEMDVVTFFMYDVLDVVVVAVERTRVVGNYPASQHPLGLWYWVTCHTKCLFYHLLNTQLEGGVRDC